MANPVVRFEIGAAEDQPLVRFYGELFGWGLQAVADGLVSDVFVGAGLFEGQQAFYVPGTALTVDLPGRGPRTYVAGRADLAGGRVVRPDDAQPVGSGTKPMTALLVLELVRRGRIGIVLQAFHLLPRAFSSRIGSAIMLATRPTPWVMLLAISSPTVRLRSAMVEYYCNSSGNCV